MVQFARPSADINPSNFTDQSGGTPLYAVLDEATPDDADYIKSPDDPVNEFCTFFVSAVTDPSVHTGHIVRYRYRKSAASGVKITLQVTLYQSGVGAIEAGPSHSNIAETWTDGSFTVSEANAANITDYSKLYLRVYATKSAGGASRNGQVSWTEVEVPDAGGASYSITGAVTVTPQVAATLDYTLNAAIAGAVTVMPTIAAGMVYQGEATIVGDVTISVTPAAAMVEGRSIAGAATVALSVAAAMARNIHPALAGSVTIGTAAAAVLDYTRNAALAGAVTVTSGVAASLALTRHRALAGSLVLGVTPAALGMIHSGPSAIVAQTQLAGEVRLSEMDGVSGPIKLTGKVA